MTHEEIKSKATKIAKAIVIDCLRYVNHDFGDSSVQEACIAEWTRIVAGILELQHEPVVSSNIKSIGYSPTFQRLEVRFSTGALYEYEEVPQSVYESLLNAESKGSYFNRTIRKGGYRYRKVG